jgi:hypothetical protein
MIEARIAYFVSDSSPPNLETHITQVATYVAMFEETADNHAE